MAIKSSKDYARDYTKPDLREKLKEQIKESTKGGKKGQWSVRKSQILKKEYEENGGEYRHKGSKTTAQENLTTWSNENWQTDNHAKAVQPAKTKRYLPKKVWDNLTGQEKEEAEHSKVKASKKGQQKVPNTDKTKHILYNNSTPSHKKGAPPMNESAKHIPPASVARNASKGLKLRKDFNRGGTEIGLERAKQLSSKRSIDLSIIKRMSSYFARHTIDKKAENFGNNAKPSNGFIAWLLWGGDAGKRWADKIKKQFSKKNK